MVDKNINENKKTQAEQALQELLEGKAIWVHTKEGFHKLIDAFGLDGDIIAFYYLGHIGDLDKTHIADIRILSIPVSLLKDKEIDFGDKKIYASKKAIEMIDQMNKV